MWRVAQMSVVDVASGTVTKIHDQLPQPGAPTWSPDGKVVALAGIAPMTRRFREGTNQVLTIPVRLKPDATTTPTRGRPNSYVASGFSRTDDNGDIWYAPEPFLSIDSRGGCGPAWSPDGTKMAAIYEGVLAVWPVAATGEPLGPPRRVSNESAHSPS